MEWTLGDGVRQIGGGRETRKPDTCHLFFLHSYKPIVDYIDAQFEHFLQEELKIKRSLHNYHDTRIHVCLYFISPTGHSLRSLDLVTMKKLDSKVSNTHIKVQMVHEYSLYMRKCDTDTDCEMDF